MATVVEVQQAKPRIGSITLKLEKYEAADLNVVISDWYKLNYGTNFEKQRDRHPTYAAIRDALEGKTPESAVKINAFL